MSALERVKEALAYAERIANKYPEEESHLTPAAVGIPDLRALVRVVEAVEVWDAATLDEGKHIRDSAVMRLNVGEAESAAAMREGYRLATVRAEAANTVRAALRAATGEG